MSRRNLAGLWVLGFVLAVGASPAAEASSSLIFPRLSYDENTFTGLAIANLSPQSADVTLTAYGFDGQQIAHPGFVNPVTLTIGPGRQIARLITEIFQGSLPPGVVGWIHVTSPVDDITGFFLFLNSQLTQFDGADLPVAANEIIFNMVRTDAGQSTELNLVNPGNADVVVSLTLVRDQTETEKSVNLPARSVLRLDAATYFESTDIGPGAYLRAKANLGNIAGFQFVRTSGGDLLGLNAQSATALQNRLYFPQMVVLDPWKSEIGIVNYTDEPLLLTVSAREPDGTLFGPANLQTNPVALGLEGRGSVVLDIKDLFGFSGNSPLDGWIEVEASSPGINGYISYGIPSLGSLAAISTVPKPNKASVFSHIATSAGYFTGLAILNSSTLSANTRVLALDPDGQVLGSFDTVIRPGQRISRLITELIPQTANRGNGMVWVQSDVPLYSSSLFGSDRILANVPPQEAPSAFRPDQALGKLKVSPALGVVQPGRNLQFSATGLAGPLVWSVDGVPGGTAATGLINAAGTYTAPAQKPSPSFVTVAAAVSDLLAGASVDILTTQELLGDLGLLQSIVYLQSLQRLFEVELLAAAGFELGPSPGSRFQTGNQSELFQVAPPAIRTSVRDFNDNIVKMAAFTSSGGKEFILLLGQDSGNLLRLDPATRQTQVVYSGMNRPTSVAVDPLSGNALVAEADRITEISRPFIEAGVSAAGDGSAARSGGPVDQATLAPVEGATGLAVDNCTGEIYFSVAEEGAIKVYDRETGEVQILVSGLSGPTQLLVLYRKGLPCPDTVQILVVEPEADRISLISPALGEIVDWISAPGVKDLVFLPEGNPYNGRASIAYGSFFGEAGSISIIEVGDQYGDPPPAPETGPCVSDAFFDDPNLERVVRQALGLDAEEVLTCEAVEGLTELNASSQNIGSLNGIEYLIGLEHLDVSDNRIRSLVPVAGLTNLITLNASHNLIANIDLVSNLGNLVALNLSHNLLSDLSPLAGPGVASAAAASEGNIRLSQLSSLNELYLGFNEISDLSPLAGLIGLTILDLRSNQIADLSALLANPGLGSGDQVLLEDNPLGQAGCAAILELLRRGIAVEFDVDCSIDLAVRVTSPSLSAKYGDLLLFRVQVFNQGSAWVEDAVLTNVLPSGTAFRSARGLGATCLHESGTVVCRWPSLEPGAVREVQIRADVRIQTGVLVNEATIEGGEFDADPSNNTDSVTIPLAEADLAVTKTASSSVVSPQDILVYTIVVSNLGPHSATGITLIDQFPSGVFPASFALVGGFCSLDSEGSVLTCTIPELAAGDSRTLTIETLVLGGETLTNHVSVTASEYDPNRLNNTASVTVAQAAADLAVAKSASSLLVNIEQPLVYTVQVTNNGPQTATGVTLIDQVPAGLLVQSFDLPGGLCEFDVEFSILSCQIPELAVGASGILTINTLVSGGESFTNVATASALQSDPVPENNTASVTSLLAQADVAVGIEAESEWPALAVTGAELVYTIVVANNGPHPATGVTLFSDRGEGTPVIDVSGPSCVETGPLSIQCAIGSLAPGEQVPVTVTVLVEAFSTVFHTASAFAAEFDFDSGNNTVSLELPVTQLADLEVTKIASTDRMRCGQEEETVYTITAINHGPSPASGVVLTDTPSPDMFVETWDNPPGVECFQDDITGDLVCPIGTLEIGAEAVLFVYSYFSCETEAETVDNTATVTGNETDPDPDNNSVTLQIPIAAADLAVTWFGEPDPITAFGEILTLTAAVTNLGPDTATFVGLFFNLDPEVDFVDYSSPDDPGLFCNTDFVQEFGFLFCDLSDLPSGDAVTVIVEVENRLDAEGTLTNTVSVSASERDPDGGNNFAEEVTTVDIIG
jgi:uncharacterized repeat protein (TIGR01451 family)